MPSSIRTERAPRWGLAVLIAFSVAAACEGDAGEQVAVDSGGTPPADTSQGSPDTADPGVGDHPHWAGASWAAFLPGTDETAVYHVRTFDNIERDLTARLVHGVAWQGGTWSQIVVGDLEAGKDGMAIYVDLSTPWVARCKGVEVYSTSTATGPSMVESFDDPILIPLDQAAGTPTTFETRIHGNYGGFESEMGVSYAITVESYDHVQTVPLGELSGCVKLVATLSGELIGEGNLEVEVVAHPTERIVRWVDSPGFILAEIKESWQ